MYFYADFSVHLSKSQLVRKIQSKSLSIWCVVGVVSTFCNFFYTYRLSMVALTSYYWVRWHPSRTILRTVSADRTSLFFSSPFSFPLTRLSSPEERGARDQRASALSEREVFRYEGVTRYIGTEGDAFVLFIFILSLFFAPNSRTQEKTATSGETELQTDDFNRLFLNDIALFVINRWTLSEG